jgi:ABC-2 type transport system ATP-binding protein
VIPFVPLALEIRSLVKRFDRPAVDGLDLAVRRGEFYALLGPNGAGKTTTLRMVAGLIRPDAGSIHVAGIDALADPVAAKRVTAWVSDEPMIYDKLTPEEYLEFVAGLWSVEPALAAARARELLDWLGLSPHARERCETFSKGMRQKVALAGALVHEPSLIILDEPLTGLDAGSARQVKNVLRERARAGATVIMTTHILEVAERMADRIGVIAHGRLVAEGTSTNCAARRATMSAIARTLASAATRASKTRSWRWSPRRRKPREVLILPLRHSGSRAAAVWNP